MLPVLQQLYDTSTIDTRLDRKYNKYIAIEAEKLHISNYKNWARIDNI